MPGQIKRMLDVIIQQRSKGDPTLALTTKTKLILKGINPDRYNVTSPDDPAMIAKVHAVATELGIRV